ncbi:MAG: NAD-dependent epimerase/dehydratase family protein [Gammaproteobacteria bacterium]
MRTLVVTGAAGFIGRRLVTAGLARGWAVRALVRDPSSMPMGDHLNAYRWDASAAETRAHLLEGADAVCHLAALIPPDGNNPAFAKPCFGVNALGTLSLLAAAHEAGVSRFVHVASGNAYAPRPGLVGENHSLYPSERSPYYFISKIAGEVFVDHWRRTRGLSSCVLRLGSVYGPGMKSKGLVPIFTQRLHAGQPIVVRDGGGFATDLVFVDDVVSAAHSALEGDVIGAFNIGSGVRTTVRELAALLVEIVGADPSLVTIGSPGAAPDIGFAGLDVSRARAELGYRPTPLREGLRRYVRWLSSS